MDYELVSLKENFIVKKICSIHYFEYTKNFMFSGESHDFWEFVYLDKGEALVCSDDKWIKLNAGEIIFHKPNEFHNIKANGVIAPNSVIVSFACSSKYMKYFRNKIMKVGDFERQLLSTIVNEAQNAFSNELGIVQFEKLERKENQRFGAEQIIKLSIESLLISLYRSTDLKTVRLSGTIKTQTENDIIEKVVEYINCNISSPISFKDITSYAKISGTSLKNAFKQRMGMGVMTYFRNAKIDYAKILIREANFNITQISEKLGYSGIDKFSRQFKAVTGMSPTEYARSVKAHLEH
ncbi:MAG: helix-turn-helix domain-containing protein [Clostridia bacterium]|nr:helix-turn-helix domain-containing protein [Clostridia bacterium]